jgi:hypothetical protein
VPPAHTPDAHARLQSPQLAGSVAVSTSQPSVYVWLQSRKGDSQRAILQHGESEHVGSRLHSPMPPATVHDRPHERQLFGSVWRFVSQPSEGSPLQSPQWSEHWSTAQAWSVEQRAVAFGTAQGVHAAKPHPDCGSSRPMHRPPHAFSPAAQAPLVSAS